MKFDCSAQQLLYGLINATRALSARPAIQILEGVLIKTGENEIFLTCTDGSVSIRTVVQASVIEPGAVVLPGKLLTEIVRKLPEGTVSVQLKSKQLVVVQCCQSRSTITGMIPDDFPETRDLSSLQALQLPQKRLREMINKVVFAIAIKESRQELTGCLFEVSRNELRLVALDGFRLALQRMSGEFLLPEKKDQISAIIPGNVMNEMGRIMDNEEEDVSFYLDQTHLMAVMGNATLVTTLLGGEYINYRQILPVDWITRVIANKKDLQDAIERASLMAREGKSNLVRISAKDDILRITSMSDLGDVLEEMEIQLEGEEIEIAFNARYISDVVKNIDDEFCSLSMNTNVSPCVIGPVEGDEYLYLVLPVRVHN